MLILITTLLMGCGEKADDTATEEPEVQEEN